MALIFFVGFPRTLSNITGDFCSPVLLSLVRGCYSFFVTRTPRAPEQIYLFSTEYHIQIDFFTFSTTVMYIKVSRL